MLESGVLSLRQLIMARDYPFLMIKMLSGLYFVVVVVVVRGVWRRVANDYPKLCHETDLLSVMCRTLVACHHLQDSLVLYFAPYQTTPLTVDAFVLMDKLKGYWFTQIKPLTRSSAPSPPSILFPGIVWRNHYASVSFSRLPHFKRHYPSQTIKKNVLKRELWPSSARRSLIRTD